MKKIEYRKLFLQQFLQQQHLYLHSSFRVRVQQLLDLGPLLNEILAEIENSGLVIPNA